MMKIVGSNPTRDTMMKNLKTKFLAFLGVLIVMSCACSPKVITTSKSATVRDYIYSLEPRQNGAYVMWLRYDDEGVYCMTSEQMYKDALEILKRGEGMIVMNYVTYYGHEHEGENSKCYGVEGTRDSTSPGSGDHTIYIVTSFEEVGT